MKKIQEQELSTILGFEMHSNNDENDHGETERDQSQKPNTGDWGDEREWDETDSEENGGNDNSGGAGSTGSASTNS
ncbi:hypothetical protein ACFSJW_13605 [Flavobacterium artemisiae]|uniref:Uncharacterized protein n=1 Tax=Flavobacterium artemisiae TaxID=2126556 RepID=A0ABW4HFU2_9FLAO